MGGQPLAVAYSDGGRNTGKDSTGVPPFPLARCGRARCSSGAAPFPHGAERGWPPWRALNAFTTDVNAAAMPWGMSSACADGLRITPVNPSSVGERLHVEYGFACLAVAYPGAGPADLPVGQLAVPGVLRSGRGFSGYRPVFRSG